MEVNMPEVKLPFTERLLAVIDGASYVQKKGRNKEQGYNYAMETDFLELVKPLLVKNGIIPIPIYRIVANEQVQTQAGKPANLVTLELELTLRDAYSAEEVVVQSIGQGRDPQDKACYKAMTGAIKYALAKAFMIPTGDDPEEDDEAPAAAPKKEEKPKESPSDAFITAVTTIRYKLSPEDFGAAMADFNCEKWPEDLAKLPRDQQKAFYKAIVDRSKPK